MIKLNGDSIIYVELNGTYKELGATARTKVGEPLEYQTEIKQNNNVVPNIDTSKEGEYIVTYKTTSNNKTVTVDRKVIVLEMTPVIIMTEPNSNYVKEQEVLITVSEKLPNKISQFTYQINDGEVQTVNGTSKKIVLNTTGIQTIKVIATDDHNHTATLSKSYKIDSIPPVITINPNEQSSFVKSKTITITVTDEAGNSFVADRHIIVTSACVPKQFHLNIWYGSLGTAAKWDRVYDIGKGPYIMDSSKSGRSLCAGSLLECYNSCFNGQHATISYGPDGTSVRIVCMGTTVEWSELASCGFGDGLPRSEY